MKVKSRKVTIKFPGIVAFKERISKFKNKILEFFDEKIEKALKPKEQKERKYGDVLTYEVRNGDHIWDYNDTILSLLFFRIKEEVRKKTRIMSYAMDRDYSVIDIHLKRLIGLNIESLAEEMIGCKAKTLDINSLVTEFLITGRDTGFEHPNKYQVNLSDELKEKSLDELIEMSKKIIDEISKDEIRLSQNLRARDIRLKSEFINNNKKVKTTKQRTITEINKKQKKKDLKNAGITKQTPIESVITKQTPIESGITIEIGDKMNHPTFGIGEVIELLTKDKSKIDFNLGKNGGTPKGETEMANSYIRKFIC